MKPRKRGIESAESCAKAPLSPLILQNSMFAHISKKGRSSQEELHAEATVDLTFDVRNAELSCRALSQHHESIQRETPCGEKTPAHCNKLLPRISGPRTKLGLVRERVHENKTRGEEPNKDRQKSKTKKKSRTWENRWQVKAHYIALSGLTRHQSTWNSDKRKGAALVPT